MITHVRLIVPIYNLTEQALSLLADVDSQQGLISVKALPPSTQNLVEPKSYILLVYTSRARTPIDVRVTLTIDEGVKDKNFGLRAVRLPDRTTATVALLQADGHAFAFMHDLGALVLNNEAKTDNVEFHVEISKHLLDGEIICPASSTTKSSKE